MSLLNKEILELINDQESTVVIATTDHSGKPHVVKREGLRVLEDGTLAYAEELESSQTNSNLLGAIWYDRYVAISVFGKDGDGYQIKGKPIRFDFTSPLYKEYFEIQTEKYGKESDITGVWIIKPEEIRNEYKEFRKVEEEKKNPYFRHLERPSIKLI